MRPAVRVLPLLAALALAALLAAGVFRRVDLRADMIDLLPAGNSANSRFMLDELRAGPAASLILLGLDGAPPATLGRLSRALAARLAASGAFDLVANGAAETDEREIDFLFRHRYLLSPATTTASFATPALRQDLRDLLDTLQSSAAPLAEHFGLADPTGAFRAIARQWLGASTVQMRDGVWFAADRPRALLLLRTHAAGMDIAAQDMVDRTIRAAFAAARQESGAAGAKLRYSGPAVFARAAAARIEGDVWFVSVLSTLLIVTLLLWRFRSPWLLAAIGVPVLLSLGAAALAVQIGFGFVHAITLGFGMTMLGITVDYPVLLIGHRKQGEAAAGTLRRIGATLAMTVVAAACGLAGMTFSGLPGLAQLGVFSVVGVLAAAAATRFVLPRLIVAADLAPVAAGDPARLLRFERLRRHRGWALGVVAAAGLSLLVHPPRLRTDLAALSPVPPRALALDAELRGEVGAPEPGVLLVVRAPSAEAVLAREEALLPVLDALQHARVIGGAELAASFLPSAATQRARQAALPAPAELRARLAAAEEGLGFSSSAFDGFLADVTASRAMAPLGLADFTTPLLRARLQPLLFARHGTWFGLIAPRAITDPTALAAAMAGQTGVALLDIGAETNRLIGAYARRAWRWLAIGGAAALLALAVGLRQPARVLRVVGAVGAAAVLTLATLSLIDRRLTLLHVVALQFVIGIGLDYALFFARRGLDIEERARTLRTLIICNAMTLMSFGLLALCRTPLLRQIGTTVAIGALAAMACGFLFAGERVEES